MKKDDLIHCELKTVIGSEEGMSVRPVLDKKMDSETFRDFYYLKEELIEFCRNNNLPTSGGKLEVTERIACFLDTGEVLPVSKPMRKKAFVSEIREDMEIETGFVCTERHRAFFKEYIGTGFSFNTEFQRWLKNNAGKTYAEAITAYDQICKDRKNKKKTIGKQFEYNTYIRDFFSDNQGKPMESAIICWKYKKQLQGHNRYERSDLVALESQ